MNTQNVMSASSLIGDKVRNTSGEDLGKVEDFMIDTESGRVNYAVLSFGGILGIGDKYFAIPPQALSLNTDDKCLVLNVPKERLEADTGFDKDNWPDFADRTFGDRVYKHYNYTPHWS